MSKIGSSKTNSRSKRGPDRMMRLNRERGERDWKK